MALVGTLHPGTAFAGMERFSLPLIAVAAFTIGVIAGYCIRALISARRRAAARRRRRDFK